MTWTITSPITGGAQTGFTSPTFTVVTDVAPDVNGKQVAVSALGGTQGSALAGSTSYPFTLTFIRPKVFALPGKLNPQTGILVTAPGRNEFKIIVRKGTSPQGAASTSYNMVATLVIAVPAGADTGSPADIRSGISLLVGALSQQSAGIGDAIISGIS
jgi:hypothetical protein